MSNLIMTTPHKKAHPSSEGLSFTKMHGLGNDFVVIGATQTSISLPKCEICAMADRHRGIGFDQLLIVCPPPDSHTDFGYQIFNANGEPVDQCGNGARCLARYVYDRGLTQKSQLKMATRTRMLELSVHQDQQVTVNMGQPLFEPKDIPFIAPHSDTVYSMVVKGIEEPISLAAVGLGNPHAVLSVASVEKAPVPYWGKCISQDPHFPNQANVGFMEVVSRTHIKLRVYERGVGETLACGSGACAAVAAGRRQNKLDACVTVSLPGGDLEITWAKPSDPLLMKGPASFVFDGIYDYSN